MVPLAVFAWNSAWIHFKILSCVNNQRKWVTGRLFSVVPRWWQCKKPPRQRSIMSCEKNDSDDCETTLEKFMRCCGFFCLRSGVTGLTKTLSLFFERNFHTVTVKWIPKQRTWLWHTRLIAQLFIEIHCKVWVNQVYSSLMLGAGNGCELWFLRFFFLEILYRSEYDLSFYAFVNTNAGKWEKIRTDCYVNGKSAGMMGLKDAKRKNIAKVFSLKDFCARWGHFVMNMRDAICFRNGFFCSVPRNIFLCFFCW